MSRYWLLLVLCSCGTELPVRPGVYYVSYTQLGNSCVPPPSNLKRDGEEHGRYIKWVISQLEDGSWLLYRPGINETDFLITGSEGSTSVDFSDIRKSQTGDDYQGFDISISGDNHLTGTMEIYDSNAGHGIDGCVAGYDVQGDVTDEE